MKNLIRWKTNTTANHKVDPFLNCSWEKDLSPTYFSSKSIVFHFASTSGTTVILKMVSSKISANRYNLILKICWKSTEKIWTAVTVNNTIQQSLSFSISMSSESLQIRPSTQNWQGSLTKPTGHWNSGTKTWAKREEKSSIWKSKLNKYFYRQYWKC